MSNCYDNDSLYFMRDQRNAIRDIADNQHERMVEQWQREKERRKTSSAVKQRYNEKVYDNISVRIPKELSAAFKERCAAEGVSQAQIIKKAIENFLSQ